MDAVLSFDHEKLGSKPDTTAPIDLLVLYSLNACSVSTVWDLQRLCVCIRMCVCVYVYETSVLSSLNACSVSTVWDLQRLFVCSCVFVCACVCICMSRWVCAL